MAGELQLQTPNGTTGILYAVIRNPNSLIWQTTTSSFVNSIAANWGNYDIPMTAPDGSFYYVGDFPAISTPGKYSVVVYKQLGASPSVNDSPWGDGSIEWNGSGVTAPITSGNLVNLDFVKIICGITDTNSDNILNNYIIPSISDLVRNYCRRDFTLTTYNQYLEGPNNYSLLLPQTPVVSVTSITLNPDTSNPEVIPGSECRVIPGTGKVFTLPTSSHTSFFAGGWNQNILVTYQAGYTVIPFGLQNAVAAIAKNILMQVGTGSDSQMAIQEKLGDYSATYARGYAFISQDLGIQEVLNGYKDWSKGIA